MRGLVLDVGLSPIGYYAARLAGYDDLVCLLTGTALVALRFGYLAVRHRRADGLVGFMLVMNLLSVGASALVGDPRLILVRDPLITGLIALLFLATCRLTRPAMYHVAKRMRPTGTDDWDTRMAEEPAFRRPYVVSTVVWGVALLAESGVRAVLIYQLPIHVMAGLSQVIELAVIGPLLAWTLWFGARRTSPRSARR
nr:VC0807 family protein [Kibdelosporangium sp. MJ126-NF4]